MTVYAYTRVSTARQASEGESLDVQQRQINGYALMHGLTVDETIIEEGVSGSVPVSHRPAGAALFAKLRAGDVVIAAKLDRLFRSALDALRTVDDLKAKGVKLHLIDLGGDVAGNGISKFFMTIVAAFAEAERDRIRERIFQVKADQRDRGRFLGGARPFGYQIADDGELVEDTKEQQAIVKMRALRDEGLSLRAIAEALAEDEIALSHVAVKKVLARTGSDEAAALEKQPPAAVQPALGTRW
ncbi:MAG: recombinase family protein [Mesorhizobium sp.]|uniref:recombinase family protein n=1 Tax=Mesorhizobium sp. TaxID=1871066 RepID=UPI000FEA95E7|nr:recombinase family protein [Mesorhizobium sp.]RWA60680.1 MAG: recombinase family protein [Mesorhizobium sp.]RWB96741.1 MAG: recombinase family protein [Mesorhizobium sp.]TIQ36345.1 MAG: recombinase family protein [Mesorhizobium sp.]